MTNNLSDVVTRTATGITLTVRAKPGLSKPRTMRLMDIGDGQRAIEITVSAPPQDGQANKAIIEQLATIFEIKKSSITFKAGTTGRLKIIEIIGCPDDLYRRIRQYTQLI